MPFEVELPNGFLVSDDRARLDMEAVHTCLAGQYWAVGRPLGLTLRSWAHCLCLGVYGPDRVQAGFGRVMTDYTFRAHIADVYVMPAVRGLGIGTALVRAMLAHPELATVGNWTLTTADAHGVYARFGFCRDVDDGSWMTLQRR